MPRGSPHPPNMGKGRKKGVPNKVTRQLKELILGALDKAGGEDYLVRQAKKKNPGPFLQLLGKVLPMTVTGEGGGAITIKVVTGVDCDLERKSEPTTEAKP